MLQQPKDMNTVLTAFFEALAKRDRAAVFKMFAAEATLTDFEGSVRRAIAIEGFFKDWPPPTMQVKVGKQTVSGSSANVTLELVGGGFNKPAEALATFQTNERWLIRFLRLELAR